MSLDDGGLITRLLTTSFKDYLDVLTRAAHNIPGSLQFYDYEECLNAGSVHLGGT